MIANLFLVISTPVVILISLVGGIIIGLGLFFLITKFKNRNKSKKIKIDSRASDYQFQFKLNTGQFISNLKNSGDENE